MADLAKKLFDRKKTRGDADMSETATPTSAAASRHVSLASNASVASSVSDAARKAGTHQYLCCWIKEARHLLAADKNPESSDPFVRLQVGHRTVHETRVVPRNRFPMWEQRYLVPLHHTNLEEKLKFVIFDRDLFTTNDYLGEVQMPLSTAIVIAEEKPDNYVNGMWHNVQYKKGTQGALCLGFQLLTAEEAHEVNQEVHKLVPEQLSTAYDGQTLQISLNSLAGLRASGLSNTRFAAVGSLYIRVRLNNTKRDMEMELPKDYGAVYFSEAGNRLEIPIRMFGLLGRTTAPRAMAAVAVRSPYDRFDVKIYLLHKDLFGVTYLAKAQIPLWAIPTLPPGATLPTAPSMASTIRSMTSTDSLPHDAARLNDHDDGGPPPPSPALPPATAVPGSDQDEEGPLQPQGREYTRIMEPYHSFLCEDLTLSCTLAILPHSSTATPRAATLIADNLGGASTIMDEGDVEEVEGAEPVPAPEPLAESVLECELPIGVARLQSVLLCGYSDFVRKAHANEKLQNVQRGPWTPGYEPGATRKVTYVKPLTHPMAPPQCDVQEEHKLVVAEDGGFVSEIHVRTTAPMGENFYVRQQLWGASLGMAKCRFRITMQVVFEKEPMNVRLLKGTIMKASAEDARKGWGAMIDSLRHHLAQGPSAGALPAVGAAAAGGAAAGAAAGVLGVAGGAGVVPPAAAAPGVVAWVQLGVLLLLLLLVMRLGGQVGRLRRQVAALQDALVPGSCSSGAGQ